MENREREVDATISQPESDNQVTKNKKKRIILVVVEIALLILVVVLVIIFFKKRNSNVINISRSPENQTVINEFDSSININNDQPSSISTSSTEIEGGQTGTVTRGKPVDDPRLYLPVPDQSPVSLEEAIPEGAIKIIGTSSGFSPNEFRVKAGEEIILALTSRVDAPVVLTFYNPNMPAISIGCGPRETRWMTFVTPDSPGEYIFKNDVIGSSGQTGKMIVESR